MKKKLDILDKIATLGKLKKKALYKLVLLNDDFTSMDFVVKVLILFLSKKKNEAEKLMLQVHNEGSAVCGLYTFDLAKTIRDKINNYSNINKQPLKCIIKD